MGVIGLERDRISRGPFCHILAPILACKPYIGLFKFVPVTTLPLESMGLLAGTVSFMGVTNMPYSMFAKLIASIGAAAPAVGQLRIMLLIVSHN